MKQQFEALGGYYQLEELMSTTAVKPIIDEGAVAKTEQRLALNWKDVLYQSMLDACREEKVQVLEMAILRRFHPLL